MKHLHGFAMPDCHDAEAKSAKWIRQVNAPYDAALPFVRNRGVAVDLGAHAGVMTARMCADFEHVVAFDPLEENVECIRANAPRATIVCCAVGAKRGMRKFVNNNSNILHHNKDGPLQFPVERLDDCIESCDLLKLDIEGMEVEALEGAETVLKSRPVLIIELKYNAAQIREFLDKFGYSQKWGNHLDGVFV